MFNVEMSLVTDEMEHSAAKAALADQAGFDAFKVTNVQYSIQTHLI